MKKKEWSESVCVVLRGIIRKDFKEKENFEKKLKVHGGQWQRRQKLTALQIQVLCQKLVSALWGGTRQIGLEENWEKVEVEFQD